MSKMSEEIIAISKPYLGPATESFLVRQCKVHLQIELSDLAKSHLPELAKWVAESAALIMDGAKATELSKKISAL